MLLEEIHSPYMVKCDGCGTLIDDGYIYCDECDKKSLLKLEGGIKNEEESDESN